MDGGSHEELTSANAVCVKKELREKIHPDYVEALEKDFAGEVFGSENLISDVNAWVKEKTKGMIPEIADDSMEDMVAALINAIAFEAKWEEPYDEFDAQPGGFRNADGSNSLVNMLHSDEDLYIKAPGLRGFVKPYANGDFAFMALLPEKKGKKALQKAIEDVDFSELYAKSKRTAVSVVMPEFKYDFSSDLTKLLQEMGIEEAFTDHADFSPMTTEWLKIDRVIHKAHIDVNHKGTKAAAATLAVMVFGCLPDQPKMEVILDRPFLYAIIHDDTKLPVFVGVVNQIEPIEIN